MSFSPAETRFFASTEGHVLPPEQLKGQLEFCNVSFAYPTRKEAQIFQNLNLLVPAGTIMAVVGPSGSGKSSLVSLLLRLYDPDSGESTVEQICSRFVITVFLNGNLRTSSSAGLITIDGHDIRDLNPYWLRAHIGTVSQVLEYT